MARLVAHLVHGTWPRGMLPIPRFFRRSAPRWFEEGSDFRQEVARHVDGNVEFLPFSWGGANSVRARSRAAEGLAERISRIAKSEPGTQQVIIGHSHGGNIATHAVALLGPGARVAGIVTLATPFLHVRGRVLTSAERRTVEAALAMIALILFSLGYQFVENMNARFEGGVADRPPGPSWPYGRVAWPLFATYGFCCAWPAASAIASFAWNKGGFPFEGRQSPALPREQNLLVLRSPGDEASLALALAASFSLVSRLLWSLAILPAQAAERCSTFLASLNSLSKYSTAAIVTTFIAIFFMRVQKTEINFLFAILTSIVILYLIGGTYKIFYWLFCMVAVPFLWTISSLILLPFGFGLSVVGPTVEVTAESSPEGRWPIEILPQDLHASAGPFGRHGIHAHPLARLRIAEWLNALLAT